MKSTPVSRAALSSACATLAGWRIAPVISATGVTEMRLFTIGTPNSDSMARPTFTRFSAWRVMRSYTRTHSALSSSLTQDSREMPMVMVRTSSFWWSIICSVCRISEVVIMARCPS